MNRAKKIVGIIPARWASSRFPGKPLVDILGKSLILRTFENAKRCHSLDALAIATDDSRIFDHVKELGIDVYMTSPCCPTGSDRVWEVIDRHFPEAQIVVNIQGDEPCLNPEVIDCLVNRLHSDSQIQLTTPVSKIEDRQSIQSASIVKCVFDKGGRALYFSRSVIPFLQKEGVASYYRHLGVYCFRREALCLYVSSASSPLQECEDLEQLKLLENGISIHVCVVDDQAVGVDRPEDVKMVENLLCQKENTYLSPEGSSPLWARA